MRVDPISLLRGCWCLALACAFGVRAEPASCPQFDLTQGLPPLSPKPQLELKADRLMSTEHGLSQLSGSVHISQNGREFLADHLNFDQNTQHISSDGRTLFRDSSLTVQSGSSDYDLQLGRGVFLDDRFALQSVAGRGKASRIDLNSNTRVAGLTDARYSTCPPEHEGWSISAHRLSLDAESGTGTARNAVLRFQNVPVFYVPYLRFPIDGLRHSGFLFPIVGDTSENGFDFRWPLYLSLGPNFDTTLVPRLLSKRGEQIGGDFRYLLAHNQGSVFGEYLPDDRESNGASRHFVDYRHEGQLTSRIGLDARYGEVSDLDYLTILGGGFDLTAMPYLDRYARLTYRAPASLRIETLVQGYQLLTPASLGIVQPYKRLPEVRLDGLTPSSWHDIRAGIDGVFTNFQRSDSVEGQRIVAVPFLRWERDRAAWFASLRSDFNYTAYNLSDVAAGQSTRPTRSLPVVSADGGLRFERLTGGGRLQTLEPQLFYLYVPYRNQNDLPVFDAGLPDFDMPQLFARNRFSGLDRISDANQATFALSSRLIEPDSGIVRLSGSFGLIDYLTPPRVTLPGYTNPSSGSSDYIGMLDYQISQRWQAEAAAEVKPEFDRILRGAVAVRYRESDSDDSRRLDLAYRYRNGLLEQADGSFSTPVFQNWQLAARLRYSLRDRHSLESFFGGSYSTCCWAISAAYRRYLVGGTVNTYSNGVYLQLQLKGLSSIGNSFDRLLPNDDYGDATSRFERP